MPDDHDNLVRLIQAAIQAHRDQHMIYLSTSTCGGGIGGRAMTRHCSVTCGYFERHQSENDRWEDVERAYFRMQEGDPNWADSIARTAAQPACHCPPCPGRGYDGHRMNHCAECCFGSGVEADIDCPIHGAAAQTPATSPEEGR